jgi:hypothetical protein
MVRRRSRRYIDGNARHTFDVASLTNNKPGSGKLAAVMNIVESLVIEFNLDGVYVENVLENRLRVWLEARGYEKLPNKSDPHDFLPCYWRSNV